MFTASPSAEYSTRLPAPIAPTTTGPVWTPTRTPNPCHTPRVLDLAGVVGDLLDDLQGRAHRALGIVFVRGRGAEQRQHAVSGEVLDRPAERLDRSDHARHGVADDDLQLLGIQAFAERGRADQIGEDRRDHASFFADLARIVGR